MTLTQFLKPDGVNREGVQDSDGKRLPVADADVVTALQEEVDYLPAPRVLLVADAAYTALTRFPINLPDVSAAQTLVAAVSGQFTRVHRFWASVTDNASTVTLTFQSGATVLGYAKVPTAGGIIDLPFESYPHFKTGANEALTVTPSVACDIAGWLDHITAAT